jgi:hypothetical protein
MSDENLDFGNDMPEDTTAADEAAKAAANAKLDADAAAAAEAAKSKNADELAEDLEETDEERAEREAAEAEAEKKRRARIPLHRHEEILNKARQREAALAARLQALEQERAPRDETSDLRKQIDELQDKFEDLLFDGKKDEARKVRQQLDLARDQLVDMKSAQMSQATRQATIESLRYEQALAKAEADHPVLNPDSQDFDEDKADEVAELMGAFIKNGLTRFAALDKAVRYVMGATKPAASSKPADNASEVMRKKREEDARRKAADTASRQPPDPSTTGKDNDKAGNAATGGVNIMKLSQQDFAKLDEDTLSRIRGDMLEDAR